MKKSNMGDSVAMVGVDDGSLQADSQPKWLACSGGWQPLGTESAFIV